MKTVRNCSLRLRVLALMLIPILYSCHYSEIPLEPEQDFFPLSEKAKTVYKKEFISTADESVWATDTVTLSVSGDTLIDGLTYKKIINEYGLLEKVVRREGGKYFGRNHEMYGGFTMEYLFLDVNVPANGMWDHIKEEGMTKTEYVVKEVKSNQVINGIEYKNVTKIEVNYYNKYNDGINFELNYSALHYYADGVGEIYTYYPYPASGMFCDLNISILPASK